MNAGTPQLKEVGVDRVRVRVPFSGVFYGRKRPLISWPLSFRVVTRSPCAVKSIIDSSDRAACEQFTVIAQCGKKYAVCVLIEPS